MDLVPDRQEDWTQTRPSPTDFDNFFPWACSQLGVESTIIITRTAMSEYVSVVTSDRPKAKVRKSKTPTTTEIDSETSNMQYDMLSLAGFGIENKVFIDTIYDNAMNLVHIKFLKNKAIPRQVMKILALIIPYNKQLTSITINSGLRMDSLYEISKFLPVSRITEMCLDYTYLVEANYHILLNHGSLKHLSLSKCNLNDAVVRTITEKLVPPYPAAKTLSVLNLATNKITDVGAKYLAEALRSNRHLSYLNISDNLITDKGAGFIFDTFIEFPLTTQEALSKKARHIAYLKEKLELVLRTIKNFKTVESEKKITRRKLFKSAAASTPKKRPEKEISTSGNMLKSFMTVDHALYEKAEAAVEGLIGPFIDPFDDENTVIRDNIFYCHGNNTLCYLNIAYNDLTLVSVKKLHYVLVMQRLMCRKPRGLVNIRIDGNYLPSQCPELEDIDDLLEIGLSMVRKMSIFKKKTFGRAATTKTISH